MDKLVAAGAKTFMDVGMALVQIHKGRLYRDQFGTFEAYAASRGIKRREAYKLMTAVQISLELGDVPHGAQTSKKALLALSDVPKEQRKQTYKKAAKKAKGTPTEKDIIEVTAESLPPCQIPPADPPEPTGTVFDLNMASILTLNGFQELLDEIESALKEKFPEPNAHTKFGVIANKFAERQMNFGKAKSSTYY